MKKRVLHLCGFMRPVSPHAGWWRYPTSYPDANFNFHHLKRFAQTLERGKFDAFFMSDHLALLNMPINALKRSATVTSFDPLTLLPALASVTKNIGLIGTASTTYYEPYHVARKFASLDHISEGRAGWNVVTTTNPDAALNFGLNEPLEHGLRYRRAREFFDVVAGLWDSWADDAFVRDVENGIYFDTKKLRFLDHEGEFFKVRGPLNIARPLQGWPVIVQAGGSEPGRNLAADIAEVIYASGSSLEDAKTFYKDIKARVTKTGRDINGVKILPGAFVVVGSSMDEALEKKSILDGLVHIDSGIAELSIRLGHDVSNFEIDSPLPPLPESNASKSRQRKIIDQAKRDNLTVRQLAESVGGYGGLTMVGTPKSIADQMEHWLLEEACDGFNIMFPFLPEGVDDFVDLVVPELQQRGIFRKEYLGSSLREHFGLTRPENRYFT